jgi:hypothetical protein
LTFEDAPASLHTTLRTARNEDEVKLSDRPIFIGFKLDGQLRRRLETLSGPDSKYVSDHDSTFLTVCKLGEDTYVGKVVLDRITTDRVEDVRRNVLSILQRLFPDVRLPTLLDILPCEREEEPGASA